MLKIYGLTFDHTVNYGSCLQAYALQTVVEGLTVCGQHITYELIPLLNMQEQPNYYKWTENASFLKKHLARVYFLVNLKQFRRFEAPHIRFAKCNKMSDLDTLNTEADAFICGSDVIWNTHQNKGLGAYYLDFAKKYKFSYAASFGATEAIETLPVLAKEWLSGLNDISCREKSGTQVIKCLINRDATVVLDPVLLLSRNDWDRIGGKEKKGKYIFSYSTHLFPEYDMFLKKLSHDTGLPVKRIISSYKPTEAFQQHQFIAPTPQRWLQQLRDAEYIVTNSFHATAFSVLYHKKFFTVVHGDKAKGINVRMNDFLSELGLQNRLYSAVPDRMDLTGPDYTSIDSKLDQMRAASLAFLHRNLEAAWQEKQKNTGSGSEAQC